VLSAGEVPGRTKAKHFASWGCPPKPFSKAAGFALQTFAGGTRIAAPEARL